jgi:vacuolar-type H+-ATPase subunit I/STV1
MRVLMSCVLAVACGPALAQTVYKCTDDYGTVVFSQRPCADDPDKVTTVDTSRSLRTGSGGSVAEEGEFAQMNEVRRRCENRSNAIAEHYRAEYERVSREITALEERIQRSNSSQAGANAESGLRQQIGGLITERGTVKSAEVEEVAANRQRCRDEEAAEVKRQADARAARELEQSKRDAAAAAAAPADPAADAAPAIPDAPAAPGATGPSDVRGQPVPDTDEGMPEKDEQPQSG